MLLFVGGGSWYAAIRGGCCCCSCCWVLLPPWCEKNWKQHEVELMIDVLINASLDRSILQSSFWNTKKRPCLQPLYSPTTQSTRSDLISFHFWIWMRWKNMMSELVTDEAPKQAACIGNPQFWSRVVANTVIFHFSVANSALCTALTLDWPAWYYYYYEQRVPPTESSLEVNH